MDYGGAFDIDPNMYWTRDDLNELTAEVNDRLEKEGIEITAAYMGYDNIFDIEFRDKNGNEFCLPKSVKADPEKIETPDRFVEVFTPILSDMIIKQVEEFEAQMMEME